MIRISTDLHEIEIVEAVHRLGPGRVRDLIWLLARYTDDPGFMEDCHRMFADAVSRQQALSGTPGHRSALAADPATASTAVQPSGSKS